MAVEYYSLVLLLSRIVCGNCNLDGKANPDKIDNHSMVKPLLKWEEINPYKPDNESRILVLYPAGNSDKETVKLLIKWQQINPDKANSCS